MKINKRNPKHWLYLFNFTLWVLLSIPLRPLLKTLKSKKSVILYGHKLSGNLLALKNQLRHENKGLETFFLTMDPSYYRQNKTNQFLCAQNPLHLLKVASANAIVSDHGLHALIFYLKMTDMRFFDVWHGIPFKGFDSEDFRVQRCYDESWVASPLLAKLYLERFGFEPNKIVVTGYARTDSLISPIEKTECIRKHIGLTNKKLNKIVLFAPTWKQDAQNRNLFPFNIHADSFLQSLAEVCRRNQAILLFRAHLNTDDLIDLPKDYAISVPFNTYPDTEAILQISDVLICDWSSIVFDYLLLDRPTLFLDVAPPFRKGFSLGPEYRYGPIVKNLPELLNQLERCLSSPSDYWNDFGALHKAIRERVYGNYADGQSAKRCIERLTKALKEHP